MNYEGYNPADFREPTDEEYRQAYAEYQKEQSEADKEGAQP